MNAASSFGLLVYLVTVGFAQAARPNIVLIVADDMGYGDVGCYQPGSKIPTPHMDLVAREGIRFTDAHSADSVCTPSRYALMTGRYCWRTRLKRAVLFNYEPPLIEAGRPTLASLLRGVGYRTGLFGKWHLGLGFSAKAGRSVDFDRSLPWPAGPLPDRTISEAIDFSQSVTGGPNALGFDRAFYTAGCSTDQEPFCYIDDGQFLGMERASYRHPPGSWRSGMTASDWVNETVDVTFTERAVAFIEESVQENAARPFFVYLPLSSPHSPHLVPGFAAGRSRAGTRGDMVWLFDWCVGRIVQALAETRQEQDTLLIITSDNGPLKGSLLPGAPEGTAVVSNGHRSAGDLRGFKARVFEGGHRVPLIVRWPEEIRPGVVSHHPISLIDCFASFAALVGVSLGSGVAEDSIQQLDVFLGRDSTNRPDIPLVHHSGRGAFALRQGNWKIIFGRGTDRVQPVVNDGLLYDLETDLGEVSDRWAAEPGVVGELTALFKRIRRMGRRFSQ